MRMAPLLNRRRFLAGSAALIGAMGMGSGYAGAQASGSDLSKLLPFDLLPAETLRKGPPVLAHWHLFPISFDNVAAPNDSYGLQYMHPDGLGGAYRDSGGMFLERPLPRAPIIDERWLVEDMATDGRWAQAIGIDAFQFNIMWADDNTPSWRYMIAMQEAIWRMKLSIKLMVNFDCSTKATPFLMKRYATLVTAARARGGLMSAPDGRLYIGGFMAESWPVDMWKLLVQEFRERGIEVSLVLMFLDLKAATPDYLAITDVVSCWGGNNLGAVAGLVRYGESIRADGKKWMQPVFLQDCRPKEKWYAEAGGSEVFRAGWMAAMRTNAEMADILTWNDYSESSEMRPSTGVQYGFYDIAAYYIAWYKTGTPPPIVRDVLYYFHRVEPSWGADLGAKQKQPMRMRYGPGPRDEIELVAFLTQPGTLQIETSAGTTERQVDAGVQLLRAPIAPGRPRFRLIRDGTTVIDLESAFNVRTASDYQDLLYRAGSSTRAPVAALAPGRS
ncbi:endo-1,3-alpha-glucanase family glycosylhydrolase [Ancylobacter terrae]|uniref:endo-1,3-alpha-glucanase family glycosylhydrolase n=1 Tax=Ancylobacter sp. sgz301288 TaxID=3342077 RepID=UPI00385AACF0